MSRQTAGRLAGVCAFLLCLAGCGDQAQRVDLLIRNVTVYDGDSPSGIVADVAIADGRFAAVDTPRARRFDTTMMIDGSGLYLTPGLWDAHVHIRSTPDGGLELEDFLRHGITSVHDLGGYADRIRAAQSDVDAGRVAGPRIHSAYTMLNGEAFAEFQRPVTNSEELVAAVDELAAQGAAQIKVHRAFLPSLLPAVITAGEEHGLGVSGHVPLGMHPLAACEAGIAGIEHVGSLPEALLSLDEFADSDAAIEYLLSASSEPLYRCLAEQGVYLTPTLVIYPSIARRRAGDGPMPEAFTAFIASMQKIVGRLHGSGVPLLAGTDVSDFGDAFHLQPGAALHEEFDLLQAAGLTPAAVLQSATANAARAIGAGDQLGTIAAGKRADFLLLAADPGESVRNLRAIVAVYQDGREVYRPQ